jgi:DNA-binding NarL/FixJ family response regulator
MMCTAYEDDENIFKALAAGAKGYILKRAAGDNLIEAIKDLHNGGSPMSSAIARRVVDSFQRPQVSGANFNLTARENEILDLLSQGFRNKEIAERLFVSVNTIRTHIYNIYEKLHVQNTTLFSFRPLPKTCFMFRDSSIRRSGMLSEAEVRCTERSRSMIC